MPWFDPQIYLIQTLFNCWGGLAVIKRTYEDNKAKRTVPTVQSNLKQNFYNT